MAAQVVNSTQHAPATMHPTDQPYLFLRLSGWRSRMVQSHLAARKRFYIEAFNQATPPRLGNLGGALFINVFRSKRRKESEST